MESSEYAFRSRRAPGPPRAAERSPGDRGIGAPPGRFGVPGGAIREDVPEQQGPDRRTRPGERSHREFTPSRVRDSPRNAGNHRDLQVLTTRSAKCTPAPDPAAGPPRALGTQPPVLGGTGHGPGRSAAQRATGNASREQVRRRSPARMRAGGGRPGGRGESRGGRRLFPRGRGFESPRHRRREAEDDRGRGYCRAARASRASRAARATTSRGESIRAASSRTGGTRSPPAPARARTAAAWAA